MKPAVLSRGFRPFFLGAALFAALGIGRWIAFYLFEFEFSLHPGVTPFHWHAHEMVYGYAMAVIAGFLLTAAWNWTGKRTADGAALAAIFLPWLLARVLMFGGTDFLAWATAADLLFMAGLLFAIARPVLITRQKRQAPVLLILLLLVASRMLFWLGAENAVAGGVRLSVHGGLYLVLGMVLLMGRRVIPFFTQRGVAYEVELRNDKWNDVATVIAYPLYMLSELFLPYHLLGAVLAGILLLLNTIRLLGWHTMGIWMRPLLWGLFIAVLMINLGFMLRALMAVTQVPPALYLHAYAVGGVGIITMSMMARVTLGHTGRNVHRPPRVMNLLLAGMLTAVTLRVILPLAAPANYTLWNGLAAAAWIASFLLFAAVFGPMLLSRRADEKPGSE